MAHLACCALLLLLLSGCDQLAGWRDGQIRAGAEAARSPAVEPPDQPVELPGGLRSELPLRDEWTLVSHDDSRGTASVRAMTTDDTSRVAFWLLRRLEELGYETDDNASRILEGATYTRRGRELYVRVELNTAGQTLITLRTRQ